MKTKHTDTSSRAGSVFSRPSQFIVMLLLFATAGACGRSDDKGTRRAILTPLGATLSAANAQEIEAFDRLSMPSAIIRSTMIRGLLIGSAHAQAPYEPPPIRKTPTRPPATPRRPLCRGDCDGDITVTVNEIVLSVSIALGAIPIAECTAIDANGDLLASVDELIMAIDRALNGCPIVADSEWEEAFDASEIGWMMSGWGPGDGQLWVVGGRLLEGRILHFDGQQWGEIDLGISVPLLNWVHGTSATDIFVGGVEGTILHFDGESWRQHSTPTIGPVWGVWAVASDDVWAVGGDNVLGDAPFVLHYDGSEWRTVEIPRLVRPGVSALFKVWGSGPNDIYAVGQNGVILHWEGSEFREMGAGISQDLIGIWGRGPSDITVVGGRGNAELAHFNGVEWQRAPSSRLPGLNGVWTRRAEVAHAVGVRGTLLRVNPSTLAIIEEISAPTSHDLHAIFGDESGQILAFGANFDFPEEGVVLIRKLSDAD